MELEWAGIPSVAVVHQAMYGSAKAVARISSMPDYPYLTVDYPHVPLGMWTDDEITEVATDLAPKILALLTTPGFEAARCDAGGAS